LSFFSAANATGSNLFTITGDQLLIQTYGHDQVRFDFGNELFQSVLLSTNSNAFEFANLQTFGGPAPAAAVATPLPAALPLFVSGLGALGFVGWRRKKKAAGFAA
jgi:hypothetical protein